MRRHVYIREEARKSKIALRMQIENSNGFQNVYSSISSLSSQTDPRKVFLFCVN